jgi:hypothetical protein
MADVLRFRDQREFDATLAALRLLATALHKGEVAPDDGDVGDILTCSGDHPGLTSEEVHDIADRMVGEVCDDA